MFIGMRRKLRVVKELKNTNKTENLIGKIYTLVVNILRK